MSKKLTYDFVKKSFEEEGYKLLSEEYVNSSSKLEYECPIGHRCYITWNKWNGGRRCPYCSENSRVHNRDIEYIRKEFAKEGYTLLSTEYVSWNTKLEYICPNGHKYATSWDAWSSKGNRCAVCSKNAKPTIEEIKEAFKVEGYILLDDVYKNSITRMRYICPKGHYGYITWEYWKNNSTERCPICSGKCVHNIEYIRSEFNKEGYKLLTKKYKNGKQKLHYICPKGHKHCITWNNWQQGQRCYRCSFSGTSDGERELLDYLKSKLKCTVVERDRTIISPQELDIVIPEKKLAIEYCGLYWHSELAGKDRNYHLNKLKACEEKGYRLITIFEDEFLNKRRIVNGVLDNIMGLDSNIVYARACLVKEITASQARNFCQLNHLQGYGSGAAVKLGAFYEGELLSVMTFSKPSISKGQRAAEDGVWELHRFCVENGVRVIGIASRLLKYFERNYDWNKIFSYADLRWFKGDLYEVIGFNYMNETKPNYWYFKKLERKHRFSLRKTVSDKRFTEWQLRKSQGWNRIWDCGNKKFIKENCK
jgi:hypothetical protein